MNDGWKPDELEDRLLDFAVRNCHVGEALPDTKVGRHVAGQLVRCCTSPAPNYAEACGAESRNDFIHKMRIALKELRETRAWIKFIIKYELLPQLAWLDSSMRPNNSATSSGSPYTPHAETVNTKALMNLHRKTRLQIQTRLKTIRLRATANSSPQFASLPFRNSGSPPLVLNSNLSGTALAQWHSLYMSGNALAAGESGKDL